MGPAAVKQPANWRPAALHTQPGSAAGVRFGYLFRFLLPVGLLSIGPKQFLAAYYCIGAALMCMVMLGVGAFFAKRLKRKTLARLTHARFLRSPHANSRTLDPRSQLWAVVTALGGLATALHVTYVSVLAMYATAFDCGTAMGGAGQLGVPVAPPTQCGATSSDVHIALGAVFATLAVLLEGAVSLSLVEPCALTGNALAHADSRASSLAYLLRTAITLVAILMSRARLARLQALLLLLLYWAQFWTQLRWLPFYSTPLNLLQVATAAVTAWTAIANILRVNDSLREPAASRLLFYGMPPAVAAALAAALAELRGSLRVGSAYLASVRAATGAGGDEALHGRISLIRSSFSDASLSAATPAQQQPGILPAPAMLANMALGSVEHTFGAGREAEVAARIIRLSPGVAGGGFLSVSGAADAPRDPLVVAAAEAAFKAGVRQFSENALLHTQYAGFLLTVDPTRAVAQLERARGLSPDLHTRFALRAIQLEIDGLEKERTQSGGGQKVDLARYVDFQRSFRILMHAHRKALRVNRNMWRTLTHSEVGFRSVDAAFNRIEAERARATNLYRVMLDRHPGNAKLLRAHAEFLWDVCNDAAGARRAEVEAAKLEEAADEARLSGGLRAPASRAFSNNLAPGHARRRGWTASWRAARRGRATRRRRARWTTARTRWW